MAIPVPSTRLITAFGSDAGKLTWSFVSGIATPNPTFPPGRIINRSSTPVGVFSCATSPPSLSSKASCRCPIFQPSLSTVARLTIFIPVISEEVDFSNCSFCSGVNVPMPIFPLFSSIKKRFSAPLEVCCAIWNPRVFPSGKRSKYQSGLAFESYKQIRASFAPSPLIPNGHLGSFIPMPNRFSSVPETSKM